MLNDIRAQLAHHRAVIALLEAEMAEKIAEAAAILCDALKSGKKILIAGNGGSAADAQHFAAEIVGRFKKERRGLPAISLSTDTSILTALGNDYGFDSIFERQVEALAVAGDVVVGISTSGGSENIRRALAKGRGIGCRTLALLGKDGGVIRGEVDLDLTVPDRDTPRIQEAHITMIHILCDLIEKSVFADKNSL